MYICKYSLENISVVDSHSQPHNQLAAYNVNWHVKLNHYVIQNFNIKLFISKGFEFFMIPILFCFDLMDALG